MKLFAFPMLGWLLVHAKRSDGAGITATATWCRTEDIRQHAAQATFGSSDSDRKHNPANFSGNCEVWEPVFQFKR